MDTVSDHEQIVYHCLRSSMAFNQQEFRIITYFIKSVHQSLYSESLLQQPHPHNLTHLHHFIEATLMTEKANGENVFIPRIPNIQTECPIEFKILQYQIRLTFAMTINKTQGRIIKAVGLHLNEAVLSLGKFHVGCSRGGNSIIMSDNILVKYVVFPTDKLYIDK